MKKRALFIMVVAAFLSLSSVSFAQEKAKPKPPVIKGFKAEMVALVTNAENQYVALAEAMPEDKFNWRPAEGVRSTAEVLKHMIQANYGLPSQFGAKPDPNAPKEVNKMTDKAAIIAELKKSFEYTRVAIKGIAKSDLNKDKNFFGNDTTYRGVVSFMNAHTNQHLGQLIAYARMNGIKPPWAGS